MKKQIYSLKTRPIMEKILVEFFSTCRAGLPDKELVVSVVSSEKWRDKVYYVPYYLDEDPTLGERYGHITWSTVVINQKIKITNLTKERLERGLEYGLKMIMPVEETKLVGGDREHTIEVKKPQEPEKRGGLWLPWRR